MSPSKRSIMFAVAILSVALMVSDIYAQRGGRQRGGRGPGGGGPGGRQGGRQGGRPGGNDVFSLLRREDVQKELDLSEDQIKDLESLGENRRGRGRDGGRDLRSEFEGLSEEERREKFREMRDEREKETETELKKILVTSQFKRLNELSVQYSAQQGGRGGISRRLVETLKITDEQLEDLEDKARELQEELNKEYAKLRAEMQRKLMKELTPEQQKKFKEITGDSFEFQQQRRERPEQGQRQRPSRGGEGRQKGGRPQGDDNADF